MLLVQVPPVSSVLTTTIIRTDGPPAGNTAVSIAWLKAAYANVADVATIRCGRQISSGVAFQYEGWFSMVKLNWDQSL